MSSWINSIVKEAWSTSGQTQDRREKIQALSLAKECYAMKLELLTNATVVDDAIKFVISKNKGEAVGTEAGAVEEEKDKDKAQGDVHVIDQEEVDIQRPEEENKYRSADPTTNSVFDILDNKPFWIWDIEQSSLDAIKSSLAARGGVGSCICTQ